MSKTMEDFTISGPLALNNKYSAAIGRIIKAANTKENMKRIPRPES